MERKSGTIGSSNGMMFCSLISPLIICQLCCDQQESDLQMSAGIGKEHTVCL